MPYGSQADFVTYCTSMGYDISAYSVDQQANAIAQGSLFVDGLGYDEASVIWPGQPATTTQQQEWPRSNAYDIYGNQIEETSVPTRIVNATYEVAFFVLGGGSINQSSSQSGNLLREKYDVVEFQYQEPIKGRAVDTRPLIPSVQALLAPFLTNGATKFLTRA